MPKICLEAGRGVAGVIGHTQPRRIAARAVASRIAEELNTPLGQLVGYKLRFQDHSRPEGLIKLMTDGILLAETQGDRFLDAYDTIIIDEAHERSLNIDFLLGYLKWLLPKRPDLKLVITSATIDPERFSKHFGDAPIINVSGRSYPVEVRYRPVELDEEDDETAAGEQDAILSAVDELWREQAGDILVFLSGEREIRETAESLRKHHPQGCEVLPLYSRLSQEEQQRVFTPVGPAPRRAGDQRGRNFADGSRHPRGDRHGRRAHQPLQPSHAGCSGCPSRRSRRPRRTSARAAAAASGPASRSACIRKRTSSRGPRSPSPRSSARISPR